LRASDKALTSCGPYKMKEEDAMVYRRPYLISGSSGFALNAITRTMKKDLKVSFYLYPKIYRNSKQCPKCFPNLVCVPYELKSDNQVFNICTWHSGLGATIH